MPYEPINRRQVVAALQEFGPMTRFELAELLGWDVPKVGTTIGSTRWLLPQKVFRIVGYRAVTGSRGRDVAIFAAEAGPDIQRKPVDQKKRDKEVAARYREKNRASILARNRISRARRSGKAVAINPWMALAPKELRAAMAHPVISPQQEPHV